MMKNEIYLEFDGYNYDFELLVEDGSAWVTEWDDGFQRFTGTGDWQFAGHGGYRGQHCIHIFTEKADDIIGFKASVLTTEGTLTRADISKCPSLMYFSNINAASIDVSGNPLLKELYCEYGTFETLDLSNNPMLEKLTCYFCKNLTELNLSRNLALRELELNYSGIKKLGLHNRSSLQNVKLFDVELDERSEKYLRQVVEQNGGSIIKDHDFL